MKRSRLGGEHKPLKAPLTKDEDGLSCSDCKVFIEFSVFPE